jgi:hypothetical protein
MKTISTLALFFLIPFFTLKAQTWQYVNEVNGASISDMIVYNGELYVADGYGGTAYSINACASDIVKYDGSSWICVGNNLQVAMVNAFEEFNGELYAGGYFTFNNGSQANVIKLQSGNWVSIKSHFSYDAKSLCVFNNELYEVEKKWGSDTILINKWNNVSWDTVLFLFPTQYQITINALATFNNELYIGGEFQNIGGVTTNNIIKYNGATYSSVGGGTPLCFSMINHFFVFNDNLYVSGKFGIIGSIYANGIAKWDGSSWHSLGNGFNGWVRCS